MYGIPCHTLHKYIKFHNMNMNMLISTNQQSPPPPWIISSSADHSRTVQLLGTSPSPQVQQEEPLWCFVEHTNPQPVPTRHPPRIVHSGSKTQHHNQNLWTNNETSINVYNPLSEHVRGMQLWPRIHIRYQIIDKGMDWMVRYLLIFSRDKDINEAAGRVGYLLARLNIRGYLTILKSIDRK